MNACSRAARAIACIGWLIAASAAAAPTASAASAHPEPERVQATTASGRVEGERQSSVIAFRGIPYAASPIGAKRFRPPEPPPAWTGVRPALDFGPACPQIIDADLTENNNAVMAEDCLTLNVWTPKVDHRKRPVLFWIHGGAYVVGSSRNTWYDGSRLAARGDVVVVSINYRLGAWGFLSLGSFGPEYAGSANNALLDMVAALQWVRQNIEAFGGDPARVTIFGESAGASAAGALLSMPASEGLFAGAILQSGVPSARSKDGLQRQNRLAEEFMKLAGARTPADLIPKSMQHLLQVQQQIFSSHSELGTFVPSVDGSVIPDQPFAVVSGGRGHRVPILIGTTLEEMRYFSTVEDLGLERKPRALLMEQLQANAGDRAQEILDTYQRLYPAWGDAVVQIASDAIMRLPSIRLAQAASAHQPVYMYLFTYRSNSTYRNFGSAHAMELPFVFGTEDLPEAMAFTGRDPRRHALADAMMDTWIAFARTGNPTRASGPRWPAYDPAARSTMELGTTIRLAQDPLAEQRKAWGEEPLRVERTWRLLQEN